MGLMPILKRWLGLIDDEPGNEESETKAQMHDDYMKSTDKVLDEMELRVEALEWDVYGHPKRRSHNTQYPRLLDR